MRLFNIYCAAVLLLFSFSISYSQDLSASLVAHYKFDGNLNDETGSYNAVDSVGAQPQYVDGYDGTPNGALNFPGTDPGWYRVDCGRFSPSQMGVQGELTVSFWANWNGVPDHAYEDIIDKRDQWSDSGMVFSIGQHGRWNYHLGLWRGGSGDREYGSTDSIPEGQWAFFTITMDANNSIATFYKNGVQYDQGLYTPAVGYNAMIIMGCSPNGHGDSYNGKLDEVSFYSRVATAQEVSDLYASYTSTPNTPTPVAHYKFDGNLNDETGSYNAVDSVGAQPQYVDGYDGTPNGALNFPGTDPGWYRVDCGRFSPSQMGVQGELTVSFWANWNGVPDHAYEDIIDKRDQWSDSGMVFSIGQHGRWNYHLGLWRGGSGDREYGSTDSIPEGQWAFFTITMDANNSIATFYKNGVQYDQGLYTPAVGYNAMIIMGCSPNGHGDSYNGKLDEVSFYSRVLTTDEVTALYNSYTSSTAVEEVGNSIPSKFNLSQNYPNPFNPTTKIQFSIPKAGNYTLKVYNILGQAIATLVDGQLNPGIHRATFDASRLSSGIYIYRLSGNNVNMMKKMILLK